MERFLPKRDRRKGKKVYIFQQLFFKRPTWAPVVSLFPGEAAFDERLEKFLAAGPSKWNLLENEFILFHGSVFQLHGWPTPQSIPSNSFTWKRPEASYWNCWFCWQSTEDLVFRLRKSLRTSDGWKDSVFRVLLWMLSWWRKTTNSIYREGKQLTAFIE